MRQVGLLMDVYLCAIETLTVSDGTPYRDLRCLYPCEIILSYIPTHTRSSDPYVNSLLEKSVPLMHFILLTYEKTTTQLQ